MFISSRRERLMSGSRGVAVSTTSLPGSSNDVGCAIMPPALNPQLEMIAVDRFALREPVSRRTYTCIRVRTRSGDQGYGECSQLSAGDLAGLRAAIQGKEASSF